MAMPFNGRRLQKLRAERAWTQEQLAEVCGLSARTIQRLERGGRASPETVGTIAAVSGVAVGEFLVVARPRMKFGIRRITPMTVLDEINSAVADYLSLGFALIETGDRGCLGLRAGEGGIIFASADFLRGDFEETAVSRFVGRTIPYLHVGCVDGAEMRLPPSARVVQKVVTRGATKEMLVEQDGRYSIFAEKIAAEGAPA